MHKSLTRNFHGYGRNLPNPQWPKQARMALNFVINYEEGAESCILNGDKYSENFLLEISNYSKREGERSLFAESNFEYGSKRGIWRLIDLFNEYAIPTTVFASGLAVEVNPEPIKLLAQTGHEIASHGYRWLDYSKIEQAVEAEHIQRTIQIIENISGSRPKGWYNGSCSLNTRELICAAGIQYDSDDYSDELPFWVEVANKPHLIIPYALDINDAKYCLPAGWSSGEDFLYYLKRSFDVLYREAETSPKMMTVGLHARISGRPARADVIRQFIEYVKSFELVWICRREQIAEHWYNQFSADKN